jgi:hypothetical protein
MLLRELAMWLEISPPSVRTYLERGEGIGLENGYRLIEYFITFLSSSPFHMSKIEI